MYQLHQLWETWFICTCVDFRCHFTLQNKLKLNKNLSNAKKSSFNPPLIPAIWFWLWNESFCDNLKILLMRHLFVKGCLSYLISTTTAPSYVNFDSWQSFNNRLCFNTTLRTLKNFLHTLSLLTFLFVRFLIGFNFCSSRIWVLYVILFYPMMSIDIFTLFQKVSVLIKIL